MELCRPNRLFKGKRRQYRRNTLCQHTFSGSRRAYHKNIVPARRGYLKRTLCLVLSPDVGEVKLKAVYAVLEQAHVENCRFDSSVSGKVVDHLPDVSHTVNGDAVGNRGFSGIFVRNKHLLFPRLTCGKAHGEDSAHGSYVSREGKLSDEAGVAYVGRQSYHPAAAENAGHNGKVIGRALFFLVGGCHVDGDVRLRKFVPAVFCRRLDAFSCLFHGGIGKPDDLKLSQPVGTVAFNRYGKSVNAVYPGGVDCLKHGDVLSCFSRQTEVRGALSFAEGEPLIVYSDYIILPLFCQ